MLFKLGLECNVWKEKESKDKLEWNGKHELLG